MYYISAGQTMRVTYKESYLTLISITQLVD